MYVTGAALLMINLCQILWDNAKSGFPLKTGQSVFQRVTWIPALAGMIVQ
jgi:hypothetical protein